MPRTIWSQNITIIKLAHLIFSHGGDEINSQNGKFDKSFGLPLNLFCSYSNMTSHSRLGTDFRFTRVILATDGWADRFCLYVFDLLAFGKQVEHLVCI